jgi:hypothetical protein
VPSLVLSILSVFRTVHLHHAACLEDSQPCFIMGLPELSDEGGMAASTPPDVNCLTDVHLSGCRGQQQRLHLGIVSLQDAP